MKHYPVNTKHQPGEPIQGQARSEVRHNPDSERNPFEKMGFASVTGLKEREYETILVAQDGRCAVCREYADERPTRFCNGLMPDVDQRGIVRGLLCPACYTALNLCHQDPALMQRLVNYTLAGDAVRTRSRHGYAENGVG
ncbi:MAG: hypothetical protein GYA63_02825 [Armatimonadetes bacterium]|nr:hypothetical protein [Armatimonadota bacterium]